MTGFTEAQKKQLAGDLDGKRVKERQGGGNRQFSYLETWDIEDRANKIFGFDGWSCETLELIETWSGERKTRDGFKPAIAFRARVRVTVYAGERAIIKEAWGYGDGMDSDHGKASELAIKEAESDSEKRAFKKFGNQFGLALYDKTQEHVRDGADDDIADDGGPIGEPTSPPPPPPSKLKPGPYKEHTEQAADQPKEKPAPRGGRVSAKADPGAPKVREFAAPRLDGSETAEELEEIWRKWARQIAAAIKSAPDEQNARATVAANAKLIAQCKDDTGNDLLDWAIGLIEKRWPPQEQAPDDTAASEQTFDDIAPPEIHTVEAWDNWIDGVVNAVETAPDVATARDVLAANKPHFEKGSAVVQLDIAEFVQNKIDAKFNVRRGRGR